MASPSISVVMPIHNGQPYLTAAVRSILDQTVRDFELIAIDDGSTDDSLAILRILAKQDPRLHIISRPNTGIVGALNDGLAAATAPLIARMDGDDIALPDRFEKQLDFLHKSPDCLAVGTQVLLIDPDGMPIDQRDLPLDHDTIDQALLQGEGQIIAHPSLMVRTEAIRAAGGYRPAYQWAEDLDLYLRLAERGRLANLPEVLLHYRLHFASVNMQKRKQQVAIVKACLAETCQRRGIEAVTPDWLDDVAPMSAEKFRTKWLRRSMRAGHWDTAKKLAWQNLRENPASFRMWRYLVRSTVRGWFSAKRQGGSP